MRHLLVFALAAFSIIVLASCSDSPTGPSPLTIPTTYDSTGWTANTVTPYIIRGHFARMVTFIQSARTPGVTFTEAEALAAFEPLRPYVPASEHGRIEDLLRHAARASGNMHDWSKHPDEAENGGVYGGYLFDQYGRDVDEFIQKSLFSALFYNYIVQKMQGSITPATVDEMVAAFGANPTFPNGSTNASQRDVYCAQYAARRDKNDGNGFYTKIQKAFLKARAAAANTTDYKKELNEAFSDIKKNIERALAATAINYCYAVLTRLSATTVDDANRGSAMHAYGECVGFLRGWKAVPASERIITDAQLSQLMQLLLVANDAQPECYKIWQQPVTYLPNVQNVVSQLQTIYGFSSAEMEDFKSNWVAVQGR